MTSLAEAQILCSWRLCASAREMRFKTALGRHRDRICRCHTETAVAGQYNSSSGHVSAAILLPGKGPARMSSAPELRRDASLRAMLELVPVLYWEADATLRLTALEGMALRAMGLAAADFLGRPVTEFLFPDGAPAEALRAQ